MKNSLTHDQRVDRVNQLLVVIGSCGRNFFRSKGTTSYMERDARGKVWWVDSYSQKRVYTHDESGRWRNFTNGGTLRALVIELRKYIVSGTPLHPGYFGPWHKDYCGGDLWGYGEDMQQVRDAAARLEITF